MSIAGIGLTSAGGPVQTYAGQTLSESSAGWAGLQLPLFGVVAGLSIATALNGWPGF